VDIIFDSIFEFLYDESYTSRPKNHDIPNLTYLFLMP
jgi:hypothetical protein